MNICDEFGKPVDLIRCEFPEQQLAHKYIKPEHVVLELGGRYGSVSCIINSKLHIKTNHVVVEPDERVWQALERNRLVNNCKFHIIKGFISNKKLGLTNLDSWEGYATTSIEDNESTIPSYTLDEVCKTHNLTFDVLVADCEGFLEQFFDENPSFYNNLKLIMFEADYVNKCNYTKIRNNLRKLGFVMLEEGHQNVWEKPSI